MQYIDLLPEELINEIYKYLFTNHCLTELKNVTKEINCMQCYKKVNFRYSIDKIKRRCNNCSRIICNECKLISYYNNSNNHLSFNNFCQTCHDIKMCDLSF